MRISDVMTRDVRVADPNETICDAARIMAEDEIGALPVAERDRLIGVITDRDIAVRAVAEAMAHTTKIRDVMSQEVLYCYEHQELDEVAENMGEVRVRRMPVVDENKRLVGIVSLGDIVRNQDSSDAGDTVIRLSQPGGRHAQ